MRGLGRVLTVALGLVLAAAVARAADPMVVHIGSPDSSVGPTPSGGIAQTTLIDARHLFDDEFAKDGIKVEWTFFKGAGPAINEALANKQLDFVNLGDLAHIIGRASGLDTRFLVPTRGGNAFLIATPESGIKSLADLKGKRVAVFKGTAFEMTFDRALAGVGLTERDMQVVNLDWNAAAAAIAAKQLDAAWSNVTALALRDKGLANLVTSTKLIGRAATFSGGLAGRGDFIAAHPELTQRLVDVYVRAQQWISQPEHFEEFLALTSARSGVPAALGRAEYQGDDLKFRFSPRIDPFVVSSFQASIDQAKTLGLIRNSFDAATWVDPKFSDQAIKDLHVDGFWPLYDRQGQPVSG